MWFKFWVQPETNDLIWFQKAIHHAISKTIKNVKYSKGRKLSPFPLTFSQSVPKFRSWPIKFHYFQLAAPFPRITQVSRLMPSSQPFLYQIRPQPRMWQVLSDMTAWESMRESASKMDRAASRRLRNSLYQKKIKHETLTIIYGHFLPSLSSSSSLVYLGSSVPCCQYHCAAVPRCWLEGNKDLENPHKNRIVHSLCLVVPGFPLTLGWGDSLFTTFPDKTPEGYTLD